MNALLAGTPLWLAIGLIVLWFVFQRRYEAGLARTRAMEDKLAERRQELYDRFMKEFVGKVYEGRLEQQHAVEFLRTWSRDAWLVASDNVVKAVIRLSAGTESQAEMFRVIARLMVAVRRDMGNPPGFLPVGEREYLRLLIKAEDWGQIEFVMRQPVPDRLATTRYKPVPLGKVDTNP